MASRRTARKLSKNSPGSMAITQTKPPAIDGTTEVGQPLYAVAGTYSAGATSQGFTWQRSDNGGANWSAQPGGNKETIVLVEGDIGAVFRVVETVLDSEGGTVEFESAKSSAVKPAPTQIGDVTVTGPATGLVNTPLTFSAINTGESQYLTYAWTVKGGNASIANAAVNPAVITFTEPAAAVSVDCVIDTPDNTCTDNPQTGSTEFDSQVAPPEPDEDTPLEKKTDSVISGEAFVGTVLQLVPGSAQGGKAPISYSYAWERGTGGSWDTIDGFTSQSYAIREQELGYSVRAVTIAVDAEGTELRLASTGTALVQEPFDPINENPDALLNANTQYQAMSLLIHYQAWHARTLIITPLTDSSFKVTPGGKLSNQPPTMELFKQSTRMSYTPTEGEWRAVRDWMAFRWTGKLTDSSAVDGSFVLSTAGGGRFVPGGGSLPSEIEVAV